MFFIDKYFPKSVEHSKFHKNILEKLKHISKNESIPHMLFCGQNGCGKKTIIKLFLEMLFDKDVHKMEETMYTVTGSGNKITNITVKQSNYHIVIEPNNNNFDKYLIQNIVNEYAKKPPMGIFVTKKIFKIVLIDNIDNLSYYAQTALRRTMEKYSTTCRFIMWCTSSSRIIEPLISRCSFFNIPSPSNDEIFKYIFDISVKESMKLNIDDFTYILECSRRNIKEALWLLELYKYGYSKKNIYHCVIDIVTKIIITHNLDQICNGQKTEKTNKLYLRDLIYNMMITNFSGTCIMKDILNKLCENKDIPEVCKYGIINTVSYYEHNNTKGRRSIVHIEAAIIKIMRILYLYTKEHPEYKQIFKNYNVVMEEPTKIKNIPKIKVKAKKIKN